MLNLILASGSPRRRHMLDELGYRFAVERPELDETPRPGETAAPYVERLARSKAEVVAQQVRQRHDLASPAELSWVVLAADTVVALEGLLLGKPTDDDDAARMLGMLSGRDHEVLTAIAVLAPDTAHCQSHVEHTSVTFGPLDADTIRWYVASGEPRDKAGAYAIQGLGAVFVERIAGNHSNVVGLPLPATCRLLAKAGIPLPASPKRS